MIKTHVGQRVKGQQAKEGLAGQGSTYHLRTVLDKTSSRFHFDNLGHHVIFLVLPVPLHKSRHKCPTVPMQPIVLKDKTGTQTDNGS